MIERRYGICRTVFLVGRWAVKVPRLRGGDDGDRRLSWNISRAVQANLSERQWSEVEGVAPVLHSWLGGLIGVYPRCEPWTGEEDPPYDEIGVSWLPRDRKPQNVGFLDGQVVWLDYDGSWNGCPHERNVGGLTAGD